MDGDFNEIKRIWDVRQLDADFWAAIQDMPGRDYPLENMHMFLATWLASETLALWIGLKDGKLRGLILVEGPGPLSQSAFVTAAWAEGKLNKETSQECLKMVCDWAKGRGAKTLRLLTVRNPKVWERAWGFKRTAVQMALKLE